MKTTSIFILLIILATGIFAQEPQDTTYWDVSNYLDQPENIDVNWDLALNMKINDFLSANFQSTLIYDHDILLPVDNEGTKGRRIQLKQLPGVGLSYNF